jgi:hypothetical protein
MLGALYVVNSLMITALVSGVERARHAAQPAE